MHHFIMGKNQHISLTVSIGHGESHLIMVELTEIRVKLHVFQEIIHPSHVPLQTESKSILLCITCNHRPCSGFFSDHNCSVISTKNYCIQMFKELNRFQVLISTVFIGYPFSVFLTVIQIKHGSHCIYTKTIYMALFHPVKGIGDQEILHFRAAIIIDLRSPVRMFSLSRVCMFINSCSVKVHQSMGILRKMGRYPVQDNTDLMLMEIIDHIFEILRCSIA